MSLASHGLAHHVVGGIPKKISRKPAEKGFTARDLNVFEQDNWYCECFQVMEAHGWLDKAGYLANDIIEKVIKKLKVRC